jgi:hypothetical protein
MTGYLIDGETQEIAIAAKTNVDGVTFEPWTDGESLGFRIIECATGKVEYIILCPTDRHEYNPDNEATADTFLYVVDAKHAADYERDAADGLIVDPLEYGVADVYVNHFGKE